MLHPRKYGTFSRRVNNIILSVVLVAGFYILISAIHWDSDFAAAGIAFFINGVAITAGVIYCVLRFFKKSVNKASFAYTFFGVINMIVALIALSVVFVDKGLMATVVILMQLFIGIFILSDIFRS
jgi:uncharacterized membrane protein HdeD (DUF308 family)